MPITGSMIHAGDPYVSGNYAYYPFFSWAAGNGSLYNVYVYPNDTDNYIFTQAINQTTGAGTSVVTKSMTISTAVMAALPTLRKQVSDRAILRAMHVYWENERVCAQAAALKANDVDTFLRLITESGHSSWMYLQNICPAGFIQKQPVAFALALCNSLLRGKGAYRVHGGGFAGTVQAFVPSHMLDGFKEAVEAGLGEGTCHVLNVRPYGGIRK